MDFGLNDEQKMLIDTVRRFIADELKPLEIGLEETGQLDRATALAIHQKSKALGLFALNMPEQLGGGGLSVLDRILCEEQFGHTSDYLIRRAFGNVYEPLLECKGVQWSAGSRRPCVVNVPARLRSPNQVPDRTRRASGRTPKRLKVAGC